MGSDLEETLEQIKVIFLDVDGVLNSGDWYKERQGLYAIDDIAGQYPFYEFSPKLVANLNKITDATGAKIVVSSTWRLGRTLEQLQEILKLVGVTGDIIDKTIHMGAPSQYGSTMTDEKPKERIGYTIPRGCEIEHWLKQKKFQRINWSSERQAEHEKLSEVLNYVILDDDSDMLFGQTEHYVRTPHQTGLSDTCVHDAIEILNKTLVQLYYEDKWEVYCPACGACGEEGCCSGCNCKKLACFYGETYRRDYLFHDAISSNIFNILEEVKKGTKKPEDIASEFDKQWHESWDKIYKPKDNESNLPG